MHHFRVSARCGGLGLLTSAAVQRAVAEQGFTNPVQEIRSVPLNLMIRRAENLEPAGMPDPVYLRGADVSVSKKVNAQIV